MPRLIDADKLIELCDIMADKCDGIGKSIWEQFATTIEWSPTVDAEPVRHGRWEVVDGAEPRRYGCSVCKKLSWTEDNYCSYCGAKMDETI